MEILLFALVSQIDVLIIGRIHVKRSTYLRVSGDIDRYIENQTRFTLIPMVIREQAIHVLVDVIGNIPPRFIIATFPAMNITAH
mgnify:CR=1 FL=1